MKPDWTQGEMMAVAASMLVRDDDVVLVGLGIPQIAALLAKHTHAPNASLLLEMGVFESEPREPAMGVADLRMWNGATAFGGMLDVLGGMLHGGRVTLGLLGSLQVDAGGNANSTQVIDDHGRCRRFLGSGGANDIASSAGRTVIVMQHQSRKFRDTVDFVTSPGRAVRGKTRAELGLRPGGPVAIVTDRAVIEITRDGLRLASVYPGEVARDIFDDTPVHLAAPDGGVAITCAPSREQLELLRTQLDPHRWYTR